MYKIFSDAMSPEMSSALPAKDDGARQLGGRVYDKLLEMILSGALGEGALLQEQALAYARSVVAEETVGTLLVVEDNDIAREGMAAILRQEGYAVETATDGREALDRCLGAPAPALNLLDMMLPVLDGWGFLQRRQRLPTLASIPVIITTGLGIAGNEWAASLGASALLHKPIDTEPLLKAIKQSLAG